jgi:hypothetical protein
MKTDPWTELGRTLVEGSLSDELLREASAQSPDKRSVSDANAIEIACQRTRRPEHHHPQTLSRRSHRGGARQEP